LKAITSDAAGSDLGNTRVINLPQGSAVTLAEALQRAFKEMRPGTDVKIIAPGAGPPEPPKTPELRKSLPEREREPREPRQKQISYYQPVSFVQEPEQKQEKQEKKEEKKGVPVTIMAVGNKLIVTSDDPQALALIQELTRLITTTPVGAGDFEVIKLKYANAGGAAKVLDEAFNGVKPGGGRQQQGLPFPFGGGGGPGGFLQQMLGQGGGNRVENITVVADTSTNSLLVKAKPLDMLTIRRLLRDALDTGETESNAVIRTHTILPGIYERGKDGEYRRLLDAATAEIKVDGKVYRKDKDGKKTPLTDDKGEVVRCDGKTYFSLLVYAQVLDVAGVVREVYRESMNNNSRFGFGTGGGGGAFFGGGFNAGGFGNAT